MYVSLYIYVCVHIHTIKVYVSIYMYICVYIHTYICIHSHELSRDGIDRKSNKSVYIYIYIYVKVYVSIYIYMCVYTYIYMHTFSRAVT